MSGAKRKTAYRKSVESSVLNDFPEPGENEVIVRVVESRGGNMLLVENDKKEQSLCRSPQKYRQVVWVKRRSLLICQVAENNANEEEIKVKYMVSHILFEQQIRHLKKKGLIPPLFQDDVLDEKDDLVNNNNNNNKMESLKVNESKKKEILMMDNYDSLLGANMNRNKNRAQLLHEQNNNEEEEEEEENGDDDMNSKEEE